MTFLILLLAVSALSVVVTVHLLRRDGRGPQRPPSSHFEDPSFIGPLAR
jgi:hypothetical protein